jgi:cytochrome P450
MTHDPEIYDEPSSFKPERFNNSDAEMKGIYDLVFGFGRRTCPGMHFAEGTIFSIIATTFATCDVLPELDETGKPIFPELVWTDGVIRCAFLLTTLHLTMSLIPVCVP